MRIEHISQKWLEGEIKKILSEYLDLSQYRIFFFGSRVAGKGIDRSDIDVGVEGKEPVPTMAWLEIQEKIENLPTLYKIEIVDFKRIAPKFREVALQNIEYFTA